MFFARKKVERSHYYRRITRTLLVIDTLCEALKVLSAATNEVFALLIDSRKELKEIQRELDDGSQQPKGSHRRK